MGLDHGLKILSVFPNSGAVLGAGEICCANQVVPAMQGQDGCCMYYDPVHGEETIRSLHRTTQVGKDYQTISNTMTINSPITGCLTHKQVR